MLKYIFSDFQKEVGPIFELIEFVPITRFYYRKEIKRFHKTIIDFIDVIANKYKDHYKEYNENSIRDFSDAVIFAKNEALAEGKESAPYLTDENLALVIVDLFMGTFSKNIT
jgi:steroid 17alpha-monooxygenase/17alpha-hydroxyprogesterone aldolase/cytochrome P450 family 1 subfamily A polypeptide 1